jgi:hypothetical protein
VSGAVGIQVATADPASKVVFIKKGDSVMVQDVQVRRWKCDGTGF